MKHIKIPTWSEFFELLTSRKVPICDYVDTESHEEIVLDLDDVKNIIKDLFNPLPNLDDPICHWSEIMRCCDGPGGYGDPDYSYVILNWGQNPKRVGSLIVVFHYDEINSVCSIFKDENFFFFGEVLVVSTQATLWNSHYVRFQNLITGKFEIKNTNIDGSHWIHVVDCEYEFTFNLEKPFIECSKLSDDEDYDDFLTSDNTLFVEWDNCNKIE